MTKEMDMSQNNKVAPANTPSIGLERRLAAL